MKYILYNEKFGTYLKYFKDIKLNHYVKNIDEATRFTYRQAYKFKSKFRHPEYWVIKRRKEVVKNDKKY